MCDDPCGSRLSSPTCEDLGIPHIGFTAGEDGDAETAYNPSCMKTSTHAQSTEKFGFSVNGLTYDMTNPNNPFSPYCRIPLPSPYGLYEYGLEPAFIRKRNERERDRVRCVNDGYAKLREHLPTDKNDNAKRMSKVETLRCAIKYISHLQKLLGNLDDYEPETYSSGQIVGKRQKQESSDDVIQVKSKKRRPSKHRSARTVQPHDAPSTRRC